MADRICVRYAGKIVEFGTCDDIFYHPAHPYTWAAAVHNAGQRKPRKAFLYTGRPAKHADAAQGRCIRAEKHYALDIDFKEEPPFFKLSDTHYAATWLLHPYAPRVEMPEELKRRIDRMVEEDMEYECK